jgi:lipopolysaccharide export system permease protein
MNRILPWTLARYLSLQFLFAVAMVLASFLVIVFLFDFVEMLRRFSDKAGVDAGTVLVMSLLKLPNLAEETIPFATLFGATWSFARLSRSSELIVARAAGLSAWQFLAPALAIGLVGGTALILIYNPIAAALIRSEESYEARYLHTRPSAFGISQNGLWLRQMNSEGPAILNAQRVSEQGAALEDVQILALDSADRFLSLIRATSARLQPGYWELTGGQVRWLGRENAPEPITRFETPLTRSQIGDSFASPKTMSFWELPRFIRLAEQAGFSAVPHRLHFYTMLARPFLLCAMILLAATFALRVQRGRGLGLLAVGAVFSGFLLYFAGSLTRALGLSGVVPVTLAAWAPAATATLLGVAFLLHLEDG